MESIRYHQVDHPFSVRQVKYDPPSPLYELHSRLANAVEGEDALLEGALAKRLEEIYARRLGDKSQRRTKVVRFIPSEKASETLSPTNVLLPSAPGWPMYVARFLVHFVKGIFFGAGMFVMDRLLVTHRLQDTLGWLYKKLFNVANGIETGEGSLLID